MKPNLKFVTTSLLVILALLAFEGTGTSLRLASAVELGSWTTGNWWKFNVDYKDEMGMLGTLTLTVSSDSKRVSQSGNMFECYQVDATGSGTVYGQIYGQGITGTWSMNGESLYQKSDFSFVKSAMTTDATFSSGTASVTMSQVIQTTYNPPLEANKGPFEVGESWAAATTETTTTQTTINGIPETKTDAKSYTNNYFVLRSETTTVSAGTFSTLVIRETTPEGTYRNCYYSQKAGFDVKEEDYDAEGQLQATMELVRYNYTTKGGSFILLSAPVELAAAIVVILVVAVVVVVIYISRKRKPSSALESSPPPAPPDTSPQQPTEPKTS